MVKNINLKRKLDNCIKIKKKLNKLVNSVDYNDTLEYYCDLHHKCRGLRRMTKADSLHMNTLDEWLLNFIGRNQKV